MIRHTKGILLRCCIPKCSYRPADSFDAFIFKIMTGVKRNFFDLKVCTICLDIAERKED